jgi:hypothetical protein
VPSRRLAAAIAATALLVCGIAIAYASGSGTPAPRPTGLAPATAAPTAELFAGRLLVYSNKPLIAAQVRAVSAATRRSVVGVAVHEDYLASGLAKYPEIPVLVMVADPTAYAAAAGLPDLAPQLAHGAVLAATEARLRHLAVGGTLRFADGRRVPVTGIVDDHVLGGNELALPASLSRRAGSAADYLLVADGGDPAGTERSVRAALPGRKLRVQAKTANGFLSSADRVLPQLLVKAKFGEFAMRRTGGTSFEQDPGWVDAHLVTTRVPQLGRLTCNRGVIPALKAAMTEITRRGLGATVHTADFQYQGGCWNPNIIPGDQGTISRHSWGLAVDINVDSNGFGDPPRQDPRLVSVLAAHGFTWGGLWLTPDGMHFEYAE